MAFATDYHWPMCSEGMPSQKSASRKLGMRSVNIATGLRLPKNPSSTQVPNDYSMCPEFPVLDAHKELFWGTRPVDASTMSHFSRNPN